MSLWQVKIEIGRNEKRIKKFSMRSQFSGSEKKITIFFFFPNCNPIKMSNCRCAQRENKYEQREKFHSIYFWEANDH